MVGIFLIGIFGLLNMKSTYFPEVASRIISIQVVLPGAAPEEIEEGVINKIEENLKGVTGIDRITSVSQENAGSVTIEVLESYDAKLVVDDVRNAVDRIPSFPAGLEPPVVYVRENIQAAISFGISGDVSLAALKSYGREVEADLLAINGISKVELTGFPDEEIQIAFREADLQAYGLSFDQAAAAIRGANLDITGGTIKTESEELLLRSRAKDYYAEGLRDIVVKTTPAGGVVRLYEIADVTDRWAEDPTRTYINGSPAVVVTVSNTIEEDLLTITETVNKYIADFNEINTEVKASVVSDRSETLIDRIDLLSRNGSQGFFIVAIVLAMFLNWRLAFWVALSIPISFAGMFILAYSLGVTINVLSLFGMILVIGILVDDGIVIAENIYQRWELGMDQEDPTEAELVLAKAEEEGTVEQLSTEEYEAGFSARQARLTLQAENHAVEGLMQVLPAVFAAIATTVAAFSTFFFLRGRLGEFFSEMSLVVVLSLIFSLIEGIIILPTHVAHSKVLKGDPHAPLPWVINQFDKFMNFLRDALYKPILQFTMQYRFLTLALMTGILMLTFAAVSGGIVQTTFFPNIERDDISVDIQLPAGTRETVTQQYLDRIKSAVALANDSLSNKYYNGESRAFKKVQVDIGPSTFQGKIVVTLINSKERGDLKAREATNLIRALTGPIPEAETLTIGGVSAFGKPISVSLRGQNPEQLDAAAKDVAANLSSLKELADVSDSNKEGLREINILLNDRGRYLGLDESSVLAQVRAGFFGQEVQRLQRGRDEVRVWVRYTEDNRSSVDQLTNMRIRTAQGEFVLGDIATLDTERGIVAINHTDGQREVTISSDISRDDVSVSDITENLRERVIPEILKGHPGVTADFEGQNREQGKTTSSLKTAGPVVLGVMFFIIALTFRSMSQTILVFVLIPFSFIGVVWGHWLMDQIMLANFPLSLFSYLGVIALIGVLVNDALVLVTSYNELLERGMEHMEALETAALGRFRPIILTTVTTLAGLGPIMFEKSMQAQFLIPMAISVSFGLFATTVGLLVMLPAMIILVNRFKVITHRVVSGVWPSYTSVESATPNSTTYNWVLYAASSVVLGLAVYTTMTYFKFFVG